MIWGWAAAALASAPVEGGFDHTHAAFDAFLQGAVDARGVDYATLDGRSALLDGYLATLAAAPIGAFTAEQQLAVWVNAYNACTVDLILDAGIPASIRDLDGGKPWSVPRCVVGGTTWTLDQIEHQHARKLADGRVHAVLNCAAKGCPPLPPDAFVGAGPSAQLDAAARRWASTNAFRFDGDRILLSSVFDWYGEDFTREIRGDLPNADGDAEGALWFLARFVDPATAARLTTGRAGDAPAPGWLDYDWALNRR